MKRTIATLFLALTAVLFAPAVAQADDAACLTYPALPGECLTQVTYDYLVAQEAQETNLRGLYLNMVGAYTDQAAETQRQAQMVTEMFAQKNAVLYQLDRANLKVTALRAKVKELRAIIHGTV